ncbi:MAG: acyl-CoA thioesterase [Bdellovibrionales bacterium]
MSRFRGPLGFTDECSTPFRVWFTDLDVLMHMNNGKYFSLMDLARVDLMIRNNAFSILNKRGIYPVVASESMKFKKSLELFLKFSIVSKVVGWDERNFYLEQRFKRSGKVYAHALVKAQFLKKTGGRVSPQEILEILKAEDVDLEPPAYIRGWNESLEDGFSQDL